MKCIILSLFLWFSISFSLLGETAKGVPPDAEQRASIYALAWGQYSGKLPDNPPEVAMINQDALCLMYRIEPGCSVIGLQTGKYIFISDRLDFTKLFDSSVLLHEFIHYFQEMALGPVDDCAEYLRREQEAYKIQAHVLEQAGAHQDAQRTRITSRSITCKE